MTCQNLPKWALKNLPGRVRVRVRVRGPVPPIFNQLPVIRSLWNLVRSFLGTFPRGVFWKILEIPIFSREMAIFPFFGLRKNSMQTQNFPPIFNQLLVIWSLWNLVRSFLGTFPRGVFWKILEIPIFSREMAIFPFFGLRKNSMQTQNFPPIFNKLLIVRCSWNFVGSFLETFPRGVFWKISDFQIFYLKKGPFTYFGT